MRWFFPMVFGTILGAIATLRIMKLISGSLFEGIAFGAILGAIAGFLLRPSMPLVGQLPLELVLTRGETLRDLGTIARPTAEESFNYLVAGAIIGAVVLCGLASIRRGSSSNRPRWGQTVTVYKERPSETSMAKFCVSCGAQLASEGAFCGSCGASPSERLTSQTRTQP